MSQCCAQCAHWKKLVDTRQSYGICTVKVEDIPLPDPMKRILLPYQDMFGAVAPDAGKSCRHFVQFIATQPKG